MKASTRLGHHIHDGRGWRSAVAVAVWAAAFVSHAGLEARAQGGLSVGAEGIITERDVRSVLEVSDVRATDRSVTATLVSRSSMRIQDIQLVVRHSFLWNDERNPGTDNPGRTEYYRVLGEIEPHGTLTFEYQPDPPLPQRADGSFQTSIEIAAFTEVGAE